MKSVLLTAGGTGGHLFPAIAVARSLEKQGVKTFFATDKRGAVYLDRENLSYILISGGALVGTSAFGKFKSVKALARGYFQARSFLKKEKPSVVCGFGGYASVPTALAAQSLKIPTLIHEQNAVLGRGNALIAHKAKHLALSFDETQGLSESVKKKSFLIGNPVRPEISALGTEMDGKESPPFSWPLNLFITGGSQGAAVFSSIVPQALESLSSDQRSQIRIIHQASSQGLSELEARYASLGLNAQVAPFFKDMSTKLDWADLIICRAGASTVTEVMAAGKAAAFIPLPSAAGDHQRYNVKALMSHNGAWFIEQNDSPETALAGLLQSVLDKPFLLHEKAKNAHALYQNTATETLISLIFKTAEKEPTTLK